MLETTLPWRISYEGIVGIWKTHRNKLTEKELSCAVPKIGIITLMGIKDIFDAVEGFSLGIDGASLNSGGLRYEFVRVCVKYISEYIC